MLFVYFEAICKSNNMIMLKLLFSIYFFNAQLRSKKSVSRGESFRGEKIYIRSKLTFSSLPERGE